MVLQEQIQRSLTTHVEELPVGGCESEGEGA